MHFIIYVTTDTVTGEYYLGRHSTQCLDDGYIGSGNWPLFHPDKSRLITEHLIHFSDDDDHELTEIYEHRLAMLEGEFLKEHFGKPLCRNETDSPRGFTSTNNPMKNPEVVAKLSGDNHWSKRPGNEYGLQRISISQQSLVDSGDHVFIAANPNADGRNAKAAVASGRHVWLANNPSIQRSKDGTHQMFRRADGSSIGSDANNKRVSEGTHNFLGSELNQARIEAGTHNLLGPDSNLKRLAEGTHPSQSETTCLCCRWTVPTSMFKRWHGDNCHMNPASGRYNPELKPRIKKK